MFSVRKSPERAERHPTESVGTFRRLCSLGMMSLLLAEIACSPNASPSANRPLSVIVSCDTAGWIVPCGCSSKQAGGLLRRATFVKQVRDKADVLLADAGGAPGGTSLYDRSKFEAVLQGELEMNTIAHNLGAAEAELGLAYLKGLDPKRRELLISTNVHDEQGSDIIPSHRIAKVGIKRIAVLGVLSTRYSGVGLKVDDPHASVMKLIPSLKGQYDILVLLAYLPEDELESLAAKLPEADLVIGGPTRQSIAPRRAGPTVWAAATNKGKFLIRMDHSLKPKASWDGAIVELGTEFADDSEQTANLNRFRDELAQRDFSSDQTSFSPLLPADLPRDYQIAGTESCRKCHPNDCQEWSATRHGRAWQTLLEKRSHVDPYCQHCHTTGYGLPGGFPSVAHGSDRTNVGCESCHGPSQAHAKQPSKHTIYDARDRCSTCHDHENSPEFAYDEFWKQIAHGVPAFSIKEK